MKGKYIILGCGIALLTVLILIGGWYFIVISGVIFSFSPNPLEPEITYGEFPISITCEIDGETKEIKDTIVCEFDGINDFGSGGKRRRWKSYLKSGQEQMILLKINETSKLCCNYGLPEYYMDDLVYQTREEYEQTCIRDMDSMFIVLEEWKEGELESSFISANEAWEKYRLKIIDIKYAAPIQNSFK